MPIALGASTAVTVQFALNFESNADDTLITTSNDGDESETRIPIAGTGTNDTASFEVREEPGAVALTIAKKYVNTRVADGADFGGVDVATGAHPTVSIIQPANSSEPTLLCQHTTGSSHRHPCRRLHGHTAFASIAVRWGASIHSPL